MNFYSMVLLPQIQHLKNQHFPIFTKIIIGEISFFLIDFSDYTNIFV